MSQQQLSPEKYIKTKVRSLPIGDCLINNRWESHGLAVIVLMRKHPKGTVTAGIFMIDIFCLGVKDCFFVFNKSREELDDILENSLDFAFQISSYNFVHNVIFNAIDFARSFDIAPHKDFQLCQYILEAEDDIEFIETPVGDADGRPLFLTTRDYPQNLSVINKLMTTVGKDGFSVVYKEDTEADDYEELLNEDEDDDYDEGWTDEWTEASEEAWCASITQKFSDNYEYSDQFKSRIANLRERVKGLHYITEETELPEDIREDIAIVEKLMETYPRNVNFERASEMIESLLMQYPGVENLYFIYLDLCAICWDYPIAEEKGSNICEKLLEKFPGNLNVKVHVGEYYQDNLQREKFETLWESPFSFETALKEFDTFHFLEVAQLAELSIDHYLLMDTDNDIDPVKELKIEEAEIIYEALKDVDFFKDFREPVFHNILDAKEEYLIELDILIEEG